MKAGPALLLAGVELFVLSKAATAHTLIALDLKLDDFKIDLSGIRASVIATNPTSNYITLNNLTGNVYLNDSLSGQIAPFAPMPIPANSNVQLPVSIEINPAVILIQAIAIFTGAAGISATLKLVGVLTADGTDIPFTITRKLL